MHGLICIAMITSLPFPSLPVLRMTGEETDDHYVGVLFNLSHAAWNTDLRASCVDALFRDRQAAWNIISRRAGLYVWGCCV